MTDREVFEKALAYMQRTYSTMPSGGYKGHIYLICSRMTEVLEELMQDD